MKNWYFLIGNTPHVLTFFFHPRSTSLPTNNYIHSRHVYVQEQCLDVVVKPLGFTKKQKQAAQATEPFPHQIASDSLTSLLQRFRRTCKYTSVCVRKRLLYAHTYFKEIVSMQKYIILFQFTLSYSNFSFSCLEDLTRSSFQLRPGKWNTHISETMGRSSGARGTLK